MEHPLILQLDVSGIPLRWIDFEKAAYYYVKDLVAWELAEKFTIYGGTSRLTGEQSYLDISTIIATKGKTKEHDLFNETIPLTRYALFKRDQNICAYCGERFTFSSLTRDHVVPLSQGGKTAWTNLVTACKQCNAKKGNKTPEQAGMELIYIPYAPCRYEWLLLQNRRILADQMEYLKKGIKNKHSRALLS